jgi:hypothetical protein
MPIKPEAGVTERKESLKRTGALAAIPHELYFFIAVGALRQAERGKATHACTGSDAPLGQGTDRPDRLSAKPLSPVYGEGYW